jgi:hypothetical protein
MVEILTFLMEFKLSNAIPTISSSSPFGGIRCSSIHDSTRSLANPYCFRKR